MMVIPTMGERCASLFAAPPRAFGFPGRIDPNVFKAAVQKALRYSPVVRIPSVSPVSELRFDFSSQYSVEDVFVDSLQSKSPLCVNLPDQITLSPGPNISRF